MDFYSKYELIDPLPGEGSRSFRGRQLRTSREVTIHLLPGGQTPENQALLSRLRSLPPRAMAKLLEVGDNEGTTYVVTEAPPYLHLADWLSAQERSATEDAAQYTRAGMWKVPTMPQAPSPAPPPPVVTPAAPEPGEFTRMFQKSAPPAPTGQMPAAPPASTGPGEFTRMFQQGAPPSAEPASAPRPAQPARPAPDFAATIEMPAMRKAFLEGREPQPAPSAPAQVPPPAAPTPPTVQASEPGEFTRLFQAPPAAASTGQMPVRQEQPPAAPPSAPPSEPGEFTHLFQSPAVPGQTSQMPVIRPEPPVSAPPHPSAVPPPPPAAAAPGEFTRMFQSPLPHAPAQGEWPQEPSRVSQPGEFTRMFQAGGGNPIPAAPQPEKPAGEFTRFFQSGSGSAPSAVPPVSQPSPFSPPPAQAPSGPGGFTQMFGKPGAPPPPPPGPVIAPQSAGSATQAFSIPVPQSASPPRANVPPPAVPQGPSEYTRMISLGTSGTAAAAGGSPPLPLSPGAAPGVPVPQFQMPQAPPMPQAPQMPQMPPMPAMPPMPQASAPQFQMPQAPQMQAPAKAPSSNTLLIAIFCVLAFIAGLVVMLVVMKK